MRLIDSRNPNRLKLEAFSGERLPPYAILSHTWSEDEHNEVTYLDMIDGVAHHNPGYAKINFCVNKANQDGLEYVWIDTCCINRADAVELAESIRSMFDWYRNSSKCYAYLSDVPESDKPLPVDSDSVLDKPIARDLTVGLWGSRWFKRGWTLQELIAPPTVEFYNKHGRFIGTRSEYINVIGEITGIEERVLNGYPLSDIGVEQRLSWMAGRRTKRPEDEAYCLIGIFGVSMRLDYGEGRESAFIRLRRKIDKIHTTGQKLQSSALLAKPPSQMSPSEYRIVEVRLHQVEKRWTVKSSKELNVENWTRWPSVRTSEEEVHNLPADFQRRYYRAQAQLEEFVDFDDWKLVYWEEQRPTRHEDKSERFIPNTIQHLFDEEEDSYFKSFGSGLAYVVALPVIIPTLIADVFGDLASPEYDFDFVLKRRK